MSSKTDDLKLVFIIGFAVVMIPLVLILMGGIGGGDWETVAQQVTVFSAYILVLGLAFFAVLHVVRRRG